MRTHRSPSRLRVVAGIATLLLATSASPVAAADTGVPAALTKLTRGVTNVAFGLPAELMTGVLREAHSDEGLSSLGGYVAHALAGALEGLGWGVARVGSGMVDVVTFPVPFNDNRPLLEPDYAF